MTDTLKEMKCNRCKVLLPINKFSKNRAEKYLKSCDFCRVNQKKYRDTNKCEHNRMRNQCKECGGSQICEHKRIRNTCKDCGGASICEHKRIRSKCKECEGGSVCEHNRIRSYCKECKDAIELTIKNWINHSKYEDKKKNRLDLVNFIDTEFCKNLVEEYPNCIYCKIELQYIEYQDDLATIERVNNELGHIKSNCVIACMKCNNMKVGDIKNNF